MSTEHEDSDDPPGKSKDDDPQQRYLFDKSKGRPRKQPPREELPRGEAPSPEQLAKWFKM